MAKKRKLYLYEALELRAEFDARIKTLKNCLPETRQNRDKFIFSRDDEGMRRPSADFDLAEARRKLRKLETKRRKLNSAIQKTNFDYHIDFASESINLSEALETRKGLSERIGELHTQLINSAYQKVIYKEGRDIVEESEIPYTECVENLEEARLAFRELNRKLRLASFEATVDFEDE
jgi:hypothetical protein